MHWAIPLSTLVPGTNVNVTTHNEQGTVLKSADRPRSYLVQTPTKVIRRNCEHLIPLTPEATTESTMKEPEVPITTIPEKKIELIII